MRLRLGVFALLACLLAMAGVARAAEPAQAVFRVSLSATLTKEWTFTRVETDGDCTRTTRGVGKWQLKLSTRRGSRVRAVAVGGGRVRFIGGTLGAIAGSATRTGTMMLSTRGGPSCERESRSVLCARRRRSFRGGATSLLNRRKGVLALAALRGASAVRSFRSNCPEEPADIRAIRTDLSLATGPLTTNDVFARDVPRFFVTGASEQETTIEGDTDGRVTERVRWTVTFTRLPR